ncbi:MAG: hypothetical protein IPN71_19975 [Fibrobacteres bacterium]|nr:hypothetical protein [Fibrobacterota bacterium]
MDGSFDALAMADAMPWEAELALPCPVRVPLERAFDDALERGDLRPLRIRLEATRTRGRRPTGIWRTRLLKISPGCS